MFSKTVRFPLFFAVFIAAVLKDGDLDGAEAMYKRLSDRYKAAAFSDAGPVGLGFVALARKNPEEALRIFDNVLENNAGTSRLKETSLGKLQALVELENYEPATKLVLEIVGGKMFRGETAAKAYLLLGGIYRKQATGAEAAKARELLWKAHGVYQQVYATYRAFIEFCVDAYWQAYETLLELKEDEKAKETLEAAKKMGRESEPMDH